MASAVGAARWIVCAILLVAAGAQTLALFARNQWDTRVWDFTTSGYQYGFLIGIGIAVGLIVVILTGQRWQRTACLVGIGAFILVALDWFSWVLWITQSSCISDEGCNPEFPWQYLLATLGCAAAGATLALFAAGRLDGVAARSGSQGGWYDDPGGSGKLRWWDGSTWTEHLHER